MVTPCPTGVRVGSPSEQDGQVSPSRGVVLRPLHGCGGTSDGREKSQLLRSCVLPLRVREEEM